MISRFVASARTSFTNANEVLALAYAPDGMVWAGTSGGFVRWDPATGSSVKYMTEHGLVSNEVTSLAVAPDGTLWAATLTASRGITHSEPGQTPADGMRMGAHSAAQADAPPPLLGLAA